MGQGQEHLNMEEGNIQNITNELEESGEPYKLNENMINSKF